MVMKPRILLCFRFLLGFLPLKLHEGDNAQ